MKAHTKIYLKHYRIGQEDIIECEYCGKRGRIDNGNYDLHHIDGRGKGKDVIENLILLCRACHTDVHDCKIHKEVLREIHEKNL